MADISAGGKFSPEVRPVNSHLVTLPPPEKSTSARQVNQKGLSQATRPDEIDDGVPRREIVRQRRGRDWWPFLIFLKFVIVAILAACLLTLLFHSKSVETLTARFLLWVEHHRVVGALVYMCVFAIGTVFFFPAEAITIGGGFIFTKVFGFTTGFFVGLTVCAVGAHLSMLFCFLLARHLLYGVVNTLLARYRIFRALNGALRADGLKVCALLRLAPVIPFTLLNYMCGTTNVTLSDYMIGSTAYTPVLALYIYVGSTISRISDASKASGILHPGVKGWIAIAVGVCILVGTILYIIHLTRQQLRMYDGADSDCLLEDGIDGSTDRRPSIANIDDVEDGSPQDGVGPSSALLTGQSSRAPRAIS